MLQGAKEFRQAKATRLAAERERAGASAPQSKRRRGVAFGTGVLDDDDDVAVGVEEDYVMHDEVEGEVEGLDLDPRGLPQRRGPGIDRRGLGDRLVAKGYSFEIQVCVCGVQKCQRQRDIALPQTLHAHTPRIKALGPVSSWRAWGCSGLRGGWPPWSRSAPILPGARTPPRRTRSPRMTATMGWLFLGRPPSRR